jgi:hypothetical protein
VLLNASASAFSGQVGRGERSDGNVFRYSEEQNNRYIITADERKQNKFPKKLGTLHCMQPTSSSQSNFEVVSALADAVHEFFHVAERSDVGKRKAGQMRL